MCESRARRAWICSRDSSLPRASHSRLALSRSLTCFWLSELCIRLCAVDIMCWLSKSLERANHRARRESTCFFASAACCAFKFLWSTERHVFSMALCLAMKPWMTASSLLLARPRLRTS